MFANYFYDIHVSILNTIPVFNYRNTEDPSQSASSSNENANSNSNLVATIAATEAAIRIASDIIDSTLAHADDQSTDLRNETSGRSLPSGTSVSS